MGYTKHIALAAALAAGPAFAGGVDRSGQGINFLFEKGTYAELSFGQVTPSVKATPDGYGNIAKQYSTLAFGFKMDLNDQLSVGLGIDSPYGADVYYPLLTSGAKLNSQAVTALVRYKITPNFSVHAGVSQVTVSGFYDPAPPAPAAAIVNIASTQRTGYAVGAAYEIPEIAARVALTYFTKMDFVDPTSNSRFNAPAAVNLDFQTGIAADTLLFGSIRWAEWSKARIIAANSPLVTYTKDTLTYNLGVGRKFSDKFSGAVTVGYEAPGGGIASALAPTDGNTSIGLAGTYTHENMKITAGVRYISLGNATTTGLPLSNTWTNNSALGVGVKVAFTF